MQENHEKVKKESDEANYNFETTMEQQANKIRKTINDAFYSNLLEFKSINKYVKE